MTGYGRSDGIDRYEASSIAERAAREAAREAANDERYEREQAIDEVQHELRGLRSAIEDTRVGVNDLIDELREELRELRQGLGEKAHASITEEIR